MIYENKNNNLQEFQDFSEKSSEGVYEIFIAKFRDEETANKFAETVNKLAN